MNIIQLTQEERAQVERRRDPSFAQPGDLPQIYTPTSLAADVATAANLRSMAGAFVLEPSCGRGALISAALDLQPDLGIIAYDTDASAVEHVMSSIQGSDVAVLCRDFLAVQPRKVDVVLMHPPADADVEHVAHALAWLRPGGKLVALMSMGWQSSPRAAGLLAQLTDLPHSTQAVRAGTFRSSGTEAGAVLLIVRLRRAP